MADSNYFELCVREAGKELLARTKLRDGWLKLHLVAQAVIIGLTLGIKADLSVGTPAPTYAALAPALSLMFCLFYGVQDDLIAGISRYLASLSCGGHEGNPTWHGSTMIRDYYGQGLAPKMKLIAVLIAFVIVPGFLAGYWIYVVRPNGIVFWAAVAWSALLLAGAATVCVVCFRRRADVGKAHVIGRAKGHNA